MSIFYSRLSALLSRCVVCCMLYDGVCMIMRTCVCVFCVCVLLGRYYVCATVCATVCMWVLVCVCQCLISSQMLINSLRQYNLTTSQKLQKISWPLKRFKKTQLPQIFIDQPTFLLKCKYSHLWSLRLAHKYIFFCILSYICAHMSFFTNFMWAYICRRQPSPFPTGFHAFNCAQLAYAFPSARQVLRCTHYLHWHPLARSRVSRHRIR